jgi:hypothetical protein
MSLRKPPRQRVERQCWRPTGGLVVVYSRVDRSVKETLQAAAREAQMPESEFIRELLTWAVSVRVKGSPGGPTDNEDLLARIENLAARLDDVGISTRSAVRLLAHWATQAGAVRVSEDELLAELRAVGRDEWQQAVEEMDELRAGIEDSRGRVGKVLE